jgi:hypothetical protein
VIPAIAPVAPAPVAPVPQAPAAAAAIAAAPAPQIKNKQEQDAESNSTREIEFWNKYVKPHQTPGRKACKFSYHELKSKYDLDRLQSVAAMNGQQMILTDANRKEVNDDRFFTYVYII